MVATSGWGNGNRDLEIHQTQNIYRSPERLLPLPERFCSIYLCLQVPVSVGLFTLRPLFDCLLLKFTFYNTNPPARCMIWDFRREVDFGFWALMMGR